MRAATKVKAVQSGAASMAAGTMGAAWTASASATRDTWAKTAQKVRKFTQE